MSLLELANRYNTQDRCVEHLEKLRWNNVPTCSHCGGITQITKRKKSNIYHCNYCNKDFTVLVGTIFEHSRLPLQKWFALISLMLDAKQGISSSQLSRNTGISYHSAWYSTMRIRCAMIEDIELSGLIESDETYIGGKPRKSYKKNSSNTQLSQVAENPDVLLISNSKRGRGTSKAKIAGMVERKGRVVLQLMDTFSTTTLLSMLKRNVKLKNATVITDEAKFYNKFEDFVNHLTIKHKEAFAKGNIHINTIEGFWSILKAGIKGNYKSISKRYMPFYLAEFAYRYNRRAKPKLMFDEFLKDALHESKCMNYSQPNLEPKMLVAKHKTKTKTNRNEKRKKIKLR